MKTRSFFFVSVILFGVLFCNNISAFTIHGKVTDNEGKVVSDAMILFTNESNPSEQHYGYTDNNGNYEITIIETKVKDDNNEKPTPFRLFQNYPNPFNPSTTIPFYLEKDGFAELSIYNIMGQKVRTLISGHKSTGSHSVTWNGTDDEGKSVSSGIYIYQLKCGNKIESKKMLLLDGGTIGMTGGSSYSMSNGNVVTKQSKIAISTTYHVKISGRDIITYEESGLTIRDGQALNFIVTRVKIYDNTITVDEEVNLSLNNITENSITYTFTDQSPEISTDDILVSKEENGYLRKVSDVTIEGDQITVNTEQATLTDVIVNGEIDTVFTLDFGAQKIGKGAGVLKSAKGVLLTDDGIDLTGVELYSGKVGNTDLNVTITNGSIKFLPSLDIGIEIENSSVKEFHAIVQGDLQFYFDLQVSSSGEINYKNEINLITLYYTSWQWIGPVPVVEVITLEFNAGFEAVGRAEGNLETGFDNISQVSVGARYESNEWAPVWEKSAELNKHDTQWPPTADLNVKGYVRPVISVKFYAAAGPYINIIPYLDFDGEIGGEYAWFWELTGGIESNLGFDVSILGYGIADYSTELLAWKKVIASDYEELPSTYTITGRILEDGLGLSGVAVNIKGGDVDETVTTDSNGSYSLSGLLDGTYTITPSMSGNIFNPSSTDITISDADATVSDITATKSRIEPHELTFDIAFVTIPGGTFKMGDIQGGGDSDERPVHDVTLSSFEMSIYEVTSAQYVEYLNSALASGDIEVKSGDVYGKTGDWSGQEYLDRSYYSIDYSGENFIIKYNWLENYPVVEVNWYGAKAFAEYYDLDLPTEAEWEYACRAGTETKYYTGNNESDLARAGWYSANSKGGWVRAVGQKEPNAWGLYDMHGNLWEWCNDWYDSDYYSSSSSSNPTGPQAGSHRVLRGGCWNLSTAYRCRSADRSGCWPAFSDIFQGFRVVRR